MNLTQIFGNDSAYGRFFTRLGILIAGNILFCLTCLPVVTIGAGYTALYRVVLCAMRSREPINPFKEYWQGLRSGFLQSTLAFLLLAAFYALAALDIYWCRRLGGVFQYVSYGVWAITFAVSAVGIHLFPVIAAFETNFVGQLRNALYFACQNPLHTLVMLFFTGMPIYLTVSDPKFLPLYGFIWVLCGWGLIVQVCSSLLLPRFKPHLDTAPELPDTSERKTLEEMEKLGM